MHKKVILIKYTWKFKITQCSALQRCKGFQRSLQSESLEKALEGRSKISRANLL